MNIFIPLAELAVILALSVVVAGILYIITGPHSAINKYCVEKRVLDGGENKSICCDCGKLFAPAEVRKELSLFVKTPAKCPGCARKEYELNLIRWEGDGGICV